MIKKFKTNIALTLRFPHVGSRRKQIVVHNKYLILIHVNMIHVNTCSVIQKYTLLQNRRIASKRQF